MKKIYHKSIELSGINKYYNGIYHNVFIILDKKENKYNYNINLKLIMNNQILKTGEIKGFNKSIMSIYKKDIKDIVNIIERNNTIKLDFKNLDKKEIYINNNLFRFREIIKLQEFVKEVTL
jgi:hypothetical protein